jgi:heme/copper-type cytochrome/quinol oxidase subunit 4
MTPSMMLRRREPITSLVWVALIVATCVSWILGSEDAHSAQIGSVGIIFIAFVKVRLVGMYFMELRYSAVTLRAIFEIYVAAAWALVTGFYLAC